MLWLDLANAYGSIPHKLIELDLHHNPVPKKIKDLILDYYNNFRMRVRKIRMALPREGKITGCTISIAESAEVVCRRPLSKSQVWQPHLRAYMDVKE